LDFGLDWDYLMMMVMGVVLLELFFEAVIAVVEITLVMIDGLMEVVVLFLILLVHLLVLIGFRIGRLCNIILVSLLFRIFAICYHGQTNSQKQQ